MSLPLDEVSIKDKEWESTAAKYKNNHCTSHRFVDLLLHYLNEDDCIEEATDNNEMEDASTVDNENEILGKSY